MLKQVLKDPCHFTMNKELKKKVTFCMTLIVIEFLPPMLKGKGHLSE